MAFDPVQKILAIGTQTGALRLYPFLILCKMKVKKGVKFSPALCTRVNKRHKTLYLPMSNVFFFFYKRHMIQSLASIPSLGMHTVSNLFSSLCPPPQKDKKKMQSTEREVESSVVGSSYTDVFIRSQQPPSPGSPRLISGICAVA